MFLFLLLVTLRFLSGVSTTHFSCKWYASCSLCNCTENCTIIDCSSRNLTRVPKHLPPNTTHLSLYNNTFLVLENDEFQNMTNIEWLDISYNHILADIRKNAFKGLGRLKFLDLRFIHNHIHEEKVFLHLPNLKELRINGVLNKEKKTPGNIDQVLAPLRNLEILWLDWYNMTFEKGFKNLTSLKELAMSGWQNQGNCNIPYVHRDMFLNIPMIQNISMQRCMIDDMDPDAFSNLIHLRQLDLSSNYMGLEKASKIFTGLQSTNISILKLNNIYFDQGAGIVLKKQYMAHLEHLNLTEFHFDRNKVEIIDPGVLGKLPKTLRYISAKQNMFKYGRYFFETSHLSNVEEIDLSYQHFAPFSKRSAEEKEEGSLKAIAVFNLPPRLKYLDVSHSKIIITIPEIKLNPNNSVIKFNGSSCRIDKWKGPVEGLNKLDYLDLSNNYCYQAQPGFFGDLPNLKVLKLDRNFLGPEFTSGKRLFTKLNNLRSIDISQNQIFNLLSESLEGLHRLEVLNVSSNNLNNFVVDLKQMPLLKTLDLSWNQIKILRKPEREMIDGLSDPIHLNLTGNPILCTCSSIEFLVWIMNGKVKVNGLDKCNFANNTEGCIKGEHKLQAIVFALKRECMSKIGLLLFTTFGILVFMMFTVAGLLYRFRWKLRYKYYASKSAFKEYNRPLCSRVRWKQTKKGSRRYGSLGLLSKEYMFDAFVFFEEEQFGNFVEDMVEQLENKEGYRLGVPDRDLTAGKLVLECIVNAIHQSRKVFFLISRDFWKNTRCRFALQMAREESLKRGGNIMVAIIMEEGQYKIDKMKDIFKHQSFMEYPAQENAEALKTFWEHLVHELDG